MSNTQSELKEIFKRLEQEISLHQLLAKKSQKKILRKSKLEGRTQKLKEKSSPWAIMDFMKGFNNKRG